MIGSAAGTGWQGPPPREICIVMLSAIGDAVHVLPVANALRRAWPDSRITWVIQPVAHQLVRDHEAIDDFIIFERRRGLKGLRGFRDIARTLKGRHFDLLIGLQVYLKAGVITAMTSADVKLGFDTARARDGQWLFTNRRIPAHAPQHVQDQYFEFLHFLGVEEAPVEWRLTFSEAERERQAAFFRTMERPVCAVVVSTSKREKNWDADGYAFVWATLDVGRGSGLIVGDRLLAGSYSYDLQAEVRSLTSDRAEVLIRLHRYRFDELDDIHMPEVNEVLATNAWWQAQEESGVAATLFKLGARMLSN